MMIIFLDANILVADPRLAKAPWVALQQAISSRRARVLVPSLALEEAQQQYLRGREQLAQRLSQSATGLSEEAKISVQHAIDLTRYEAEQYDLGQSLAKKGVEIVQTASVSHEAVSRRAMNRTPPFDQKGGGYRDTLHWLTFLDSLAAGPAHNYVFASDDNAFYLGKEAREREVPHADLVAEVRMGLKAAEGDDIQFFMTRNLSAVSVPGHYAGEPFDPAYDSKFAELVIRQELRLDGALNLHPESFGWGHFDISEPNGVTEATLISAEARALEGSVDIEVTFKVRALVSYILTNYVPVVDEPFPEIDSRSLAGAVELTGIALVPPRGPEHMTLSSANAVPVRTLEDVWSSALRNLSTLSKATRSDSAIGFATSTMEPAKDLQAIVAMLRELQTLIASIGDESETPG